MYYLAKPKPQLSTYFTRQSTTLPITQPIQPGLMSEEYAVNLCVEDIREIKCPNDYIIIINDEYLVFSRTQCSYEPGAACREPTNLISNECTGKQSCRIAFGLNSMSACSAEYANGLDMSYVCVPGWMKKLSLLII